MKHPCRYDGIKNHVRTAHPLEYDPSLPRIHWLALTPGDLPSLTPSEILSLTKGNEDKTVSPQNEIDDEEYFTDQPITKSQKTTEAQEPSLGSEFFNQMTALTQVEG